MSNVSLKGALQRYVLLGGNIAFNQGAIKMPAAPQCGKLLPELINLLRSDSNADKKGSFAFRLHFSAFGA